MRIRFSQIVVLVLALLTFGCVSQTGKKDETSADQLMSKLRGIKGQGILMGHQDDLAYGIDWRGVDGQSDVKRVSGSYPAIFGWDIGKIEFGSEANLDGVPFNRMKEYIKKVHKMGGINTISWHAYSPVDSVHSWHTDSTVVKRILKGGSHHSVFIEHLDKVAGFFDDLRDEDGELIPVLFRPWHEMDGNWFWWGGINCTRQDYVELFRFTVSYLKEDKGLNNLVIVFSPDKGFDTPDSYLNKYPGDDVVDILGMDDYQDLKTKTTIDKAIHKAIHKLQIVIQVANEKGKLAAFTETGLENVTDSLWFTSVLGSVLQDSIVSKELSYFMLWRSDPDVHFYFSEKDAKSFLERENIWLMDDLIGR